MVREPTSVGVELQVHRKDAPIGRRSHLVAAEERVPVASRLHVLLAGQHELHRPPHVVRGHRHRAV